MRALAVAALLALLLVPAAAAKDPSPLRPPIGVKQRTPHLTEKSATTIFLAEHKVASWLERYPE